MRRIGFYGTGNMAEAVIAGLLGRGGYEAANLLGYDVSRERVVCMQEIYKIPFVSTPEILLQESQCCILAIKPQVLSYLEEQGVGSHYTGVLISILAGTEVSRLHKVFPKARVVRAMPNSPCLIGEGITGLVFPESITQEEKQEVLGIFETIGKTLVLEEKQMDALTGLSGSGPAFVYMFLEALGDAGVYCGLSRKDAYALACQTLLGSARMVMETGKHPAELKDTVASPGGTTIAGIQALEANGFRHGVMDAVISSYEKSRKMK